jgi:hypothetical protein
MIFQFEGKFPRGDRMWVEFQRDPPTTVRDYTFFDLWKILCDGAVDILDFVSCSHPLNTGSCSYPQYRKLENLQILGATGTP